MIVQPVDEVPARRMEQLILSQRGVEGIGGSSGHRKQFTNQGIVAPQPGKIVEQLDVERSERWNVKLIKFPRGGMILRMFPGRVAAGEHAGGILPFGAT